LLALLLQPLSAAVATANPFSFDDIQFWVGEGANRAALAVDWSYASTEPPALVWGYRWDGMADGIDACGDFFPELFRHFIQVQATVESDNNILIPAQSNGDVKNLHVRQGDTVRQGQLLAELDGAILERSIAELENGLELAVTIYERQESQAQQQCPSRMLLVLARGRHRREPPGVPRVVPAEGPREHHPLQRAGGGRDLRPGRAPGHGRRSWGGPGRSGVRPRRGLTCARRVRVMDNPFGGSAESAYAKSGIAAAVEAAGGQMEVMNPAKFRETEIPEGRDITSWKVYADLLSADVVINVPAAKHHSLARLSLAGKNLLGVIRSPARMHINLGQRTADLVSLVRPTLTVVDAVRTLMAHGPTGGNLDDVRLTNTVIASHDIVAADAYAATLFGMTGSNVPATVAGAEMGLGTMELSSVRVEEISL